jgi:GNAT superfamily N-acetyltransferase
MLQIRPAHEEDIPRVMRVLERSNLSTRQDLSLRFYASHPRVRSLVGTLDADIVAVGMAVHFGPTGWLGNIAVEPELRRRGYGGAMAEAAMEWLRERRVGTMLLLATELGRPVYERLGFVSEDTVYGTYLLEAGSADPRTTAAGGVEPGLVDTCLELDRMATGEDRGALLRPFAARLREVDLEGDRGYRLALPWGSGPIVATSRRAARALLADLQVSEPGARVGFPDANEGAVALMKELGGTRTSEDVRMRLGPHVERFRPDRIYGVYSFAVG